MTRMSMSADETHGTTLAELLGEIDELVGPATSAADLRDNVERMVDTARQLRATAAAANSRLDRIRVHARDPEAFTRMLFALSNRIRPPKDQPLTGEIGHLLGVPLHVEQSEHVPDDGMVVVPEYPAGTWQPRVWS